MAAQSFDVEKVAADETLKHFLAEEIVPVVRLDVTDAWKSLTREERLYAAEIAAASWAGAPIVLEQTSSESLGTFKMLQSMFKSYLQNTAFGSEERKKIWESKKEDTNFQRVLQFAIAFYANMGNYRSFGDTKIVPRINPSDFLKVVTASGSETAVSLFNEVKDRLYDISSQRLELAFGNTSYYTDNVTPDDAVLIDGFMKERKLEAWNTRFFKKGEEYELKIASIDKREPQTFDYNGKKVTITYGDFADSLQHVKTHLANAGTYAANETQKKMMEAYTKHFSSGDIDDHKQSQRHWITDINPVVESNIGFIENYRDPHRLRSEFEGFVAVVNKETSKKFGVLVDSAPKFLSELPWNKNNANGKSTPFEKDEFTKPDFTSLEVVAFCTTGVPAGINIPNYDDIRQTEGFKNVSLGNVLRAAPSDEKVTFISDEDQELYRKYRGEAFEVQVGGHELLGHGSGKLLCVDETGKANFDDVINPITGEKVTTCYQPSETYSMKFAGFSSSYEECRAECVGLYLSDYDDMVSIFGYHGQEAEDLKYVNWLNMVRAGLVSLEFYNPETRKHGQAHMQARYVILRVLLEASKDNGFVKLGRDGQGDLFVSVDRKQVKTVGMKALSDFLLKVGVYKSIAAADSAKKMYDFYSEVDDEWLLLRKEVLAKKKPRRQFVQVVTKIIKEDVQLIEFDPSPEGLIESFLERF